MENSQKKKRIFLLGGHDLEMMTIKSILENKGIHVYDKGLAWNNACLSAYKAEIEEYNGDDCIIYGVELTNDLGDAATKNYCVIDHHNELQNLPSSLEQVAEIIGHELTDKEQLIAANDKGYYPAMKEIIDIKSSYSSMTEVRKKTLMDMIRKEDRKAQGVTEDEENKAQKVNADTYDDLKLVITDLEHFSPVTDRLWPYEKLLVCRLVKGNAELCYYGKDSQEAYKRVCEAFFQEDADKSTYSGGGENGYWGTKDRNIDIDTLADIIKLFVPDFELPKHCSGSEQSPVSAHIFYFPFLWQPRDTSRRMDLAQINDSVYWKYNWIKGSLTDADERHDLFNELNYFFPFVHKELYEYSDELGSLLESLLGEKDIERWKETPRVLHFERDEKNLIYEIEAKTGDDCWRRYSLDVDAINLNLYATGVGLLSIYTKNTSGKCQEIRVCLDGEQIVSKDIDMDDILKINQFSRRVMPPFYGDITSRFELAQSVSLKGGKTELTDDFSEHADNPKSWTYSKIIDGLLNDFNPELVYDMVIDDRMFVMSWYKNDDCVKHAKMEVESCFSPGLPYVCAGRYENYWYKFLFVDNQWPTCQNEHMRSDLLKEHTYLRWTDLNSIYGVTRYSFMLLTSSTVPGYLLKYFETMYARMVELVLMQKATVLQFSSRVADISRTNMLTDSAAYINEVSSLYQDYIVFINRFYFKEVTAQDQGIELYDMLQKNLRLESMVRDLDGDIQELHQYVSMVEDKARNTKADQLNVIVAVLGVAAMVTGFWGMNRVCDIFGSNGWILQLVVVVLFSASAYFVCQWLFNRKKS